MQPALNRHPHISPHRRRSASAHPPALSGARLRISTPDALSAEEFCEPDLELVSMSERSLSKADDSEELAKARQVLAERDRTIETLGLRITCLESAMAETLETLRGREGELEELRKYLLPALSSPPPRPEEMRSAVAASASPPAHSESLLETRAAQDDSRIQRVSIWQRESGAHSESPPCELEFVEETQFFAGLSQNMAQGGLFVATYRVLPLGTELELAFELPDGARVCAQGVVRWLRQGTGAMSDRPGVGVEFTALPEAALVAIESFCRVRPPLYMEF